jgi:predicted nucleic acid-binding protein
VIFTDSAGFIAVFDARDAHHEPAIGVWREIQRTGERLLTTDLVFAETVTHIRRRGGWQPAQRAGSAILQSPNVEVVCCDAEHLRAAWREMQRDPAPKLSLCDAFSFVLMRERGVQRAFTFDRHFAGAGFELLP